MAGWHLWLDGHEFEWTLGDGDGQGGLVYCDSWGHKESDRTEQLNWTDENTKLEKILVAIFIWNLPKWMNLHKAFLYIRKLIFISKSTNRLLSKNYWTEFNICLLCNTWIAVEFIVNFRILCLRSQKWELKMYRKISFPILKQDVSNAYVINVLLHLFTNFKRLCHNIFNN